MARFGGEPETTMPIAPERVEGNVRKDTSGALVRTRPVTSDSEPDVTARGQPRTLSTPLNARGTDDRKRTHAPSLEVQAGREAVAEPYTWFGRGNRRIPFSMHLDEGCVDPLRLRAYLAPPPLREEHDAVTRDMQTTIRYEHPLDSAMRPVRPDGMLRRTREHPSDVASSRGERDARRGDRDLHLTLRSVR